MIPVPLAFSGCQEVDDLLSEYLDGELGPRAAARVEVHLATCEGCAPAGDGARGDRRGAPPPAARRRYPQPPLTAALDWSFTRFT